MNKKELLALLKEIEHNVENIKMEIEEMDIREEVADSKSFDDYVKNLEKLGNDFILHIKKLRQRRNFN